MVKLGLILLIWFATGPLAATVPNAQALWDQGSYRAAVAAAFEPANSGDPQAQYLLGEAYRLGRSLDADPTQARDWYLRAARQGDVASAAALGELLIHARRSEEAVAWLTLAASHNHARATALLAAVYYTGDGAPQDLILATSLMKKAAAEGSPEARAKLAMMDDTAPPVDVSSPSPTSEKRASIADVAYVAPATPVRTTIFPSEVSLSHLARRPRTVIGARIQVGAFRAGANARHAAMLVAARLAGTSGRLTIVRSHGFYKLLMVSGGRDTRALRARLIQIGWQHFTRPGRPVRA